jgi:hypothetical protein
MSFHVLGFSSALGVNATDSRVNAVANDPSFSSRNNNYFFTEPYQVIAAFYTAANALRAQFDSATLNIAGRPQIWPVERSATVPDTPGFMDLRDYPLPLPDNGEDVGILGSNNLGAATEDSRAVVFIAPTNWSRQLPRGISQQMLRATATVTTVADSWSADTALTLQDNIKGGVYAVIGGFVQGAASDAWRLNFRSQNLYRGRKLLPGGLCQEAIGNTPRWEWQQGFGELGRFRSIELPTIQIFAPAAAAVAHEIRLNTIYLGENVALPT